MSIKPKNLPTKYIIIFVVFVLLALVVGFSIRPIMNHFDKKEIASIMEVMESDNEYKNVEQCKLILNFDKSNVSKNNSFFNETKYDKLYEECDKNYNLKNVELNLDNCRFIIRETENYFKRNYVIYDTLAQKRKDCSTKYLNPTFSNGTFFDINNDFKSAIIIDFELDFFRDTGEENSDEYIENRVEAKKRLVELLQISPNVEILIDDVYLYPKRAILNLNLAPLSEYTISLLPYDTDIGEQTEHKEFTFKTPENKYFGMKVLEPLTIYTKNNLPEFQIIDYNTSKTKTNIQICGISEESYAKVEVYLKTGDKTTANEFFKTGMQGINTFDCIEKEIIFKDETNINKNEFVRQNFKFTDFVMDENPTGLYIVSFVDKGDVEYNLRINKPILFGIVNSHIMMKVSRDGQGFFFVNDFEGNPVSGQEISVYLNDFQELQNERNSTTYNYDVSYNLPIKGDVFSKSIVLGRTGNDGVLKVDLKGKISDYFDRTFEDEWSFDWNGVYKSFFVESKGNGYQSYLTSTWNAGIAPWNFGYTTGWTYDENIISLQQWGENREFNAHIYTDRVLYLPGEDVNIKIVLRDASDLSIPENEEFTLQISNPKGEEVLNKKFNVNEYGSYSEILALRQDYPLGSYNISLAYGENVFYWSGFNVEVFKNPKFSNEVTLDVTGLNGELVNITKTTEETEYSWKREVYHGSFKIKGNVISKYYNGGTVKNAEFTYKVYKQYYYDNSYWDDCYYGCYWQPTKEFYTEGKGKIDENGVGKLEINIDFASSYNDYKYIVEVTVTDDTGDTITGSNSIIARLPKEYKKYNTDLDAYFETDSKFAKVGDIIAISGGLNVGDWTKDYNNKYVFVIKRKEYLTDKVTDVTGATRTVQRVNEIIDRVFFINYDNFRLNGQGKLELSYKLDENAEYVFEYGAIDNYYVNRYFGLETDGVATNKQIEKIVNDFDSTKVLYLENEVKEKVENFICSDQQYNQKIVAYNCEDITDKEKSANCYEKVDKECTQTEEQIVTRKLNLSDLLQGDNYFTLITYDDSVASNPIQNDNKLRVISEKVSYNIGETAKVLIRLPVSNSKILWTLEKDGVVEYEYIDVPGNVFFKEFIVDDSYAPNSYIGVMMVPSTLNSFSQREKEASGKNSSATLLPLGEGAGGGGLPEYKVGYTEIVIDKTDKKSFVEVKADKETYKPREEVTLDMLVKDKNGKAVASELTVMLVDDSLISLMGNVDLNTLEKMFVKLPFSIQTSITNIAMLKNYYFSRIGIVGGSGYGDNKGGDSAVSTRNIFKNTAYYNPNVITDENGKAQIKFTLPDNLTNFRVMVVSNSKDNHFGYSESYINVRKNVIVEDKTPLILRAGDKAVIGANVFNNTEKDINFKVKAEVEGANIENSEQSILVKAGDNTFVSWELETKNGAEIKYKISATGNSIENSDAIENTITIEEDPTLIRNIIKSGVVNASSSLNLESTIPTNTDKENTKIELTFSNSRLAGIEKILLSLAEYPYGCIEQTVSSTIPNVIVKQFENMFAGIFDMEKINKNIEDGLARILSMQNSDGGFVYWQGSSTSDLHITPYVLRSLIYMKEAGIEIPKDSIDNAILYLENNINNNLDITQKTEIFWTLAVAGKDIKVNTNTDSGPNLEIPLSTGETANIIISLSDLDRHSLIAYTYGLVKSQDRDTNVIRTNIETIKGKLLEDNNQSWYWDNISDKAIFASLLLDYNDRNDDAYIEELIGNLYDYDWESYYYSTQSKNNAFMAFHKYLTRTGTNNTGKFTFRLGNYNDNKVYELGGENPNLVKLEFTLSNVSLGDKLALGINNSSNSKIYVDYVIKQYPEDKLKVEPYSNGMQVKREIFEVLDENLLNKCSEDYWYEENKKDCDLAFKQKIDNKYKKGQLYKAKITVIFSDESGRRNLNIEDYLPGAFRIINSNFRTESSAVTQASQNWSWSYKEFNPGVVMANASYVWGKDIVFEYYFRAEFAGTYTQPPVTGYMMYDPLIRANSRFVEINVE